MERTLTYFDEFTGMNEINVTEVEPSDICPGIDKHIVSIEANSGWWEVWRIPYGQLVAVFLPD